MQRVKPEGLLEETIPVLQAKVSEPQFRQLFPVAMDELDPLSAPEPSLGALIQLESGDLVIATYGQETGTLLLQIPESKPVAATIRAVLKEAPIEPTDITWQ